MFMRSEQVELLKECTVLLETDVSRGRGFFVAPGLVVTCAHVVLTGRVRMTWGNRQLEGEVAEVSLNADLAVLKTIGESPPVPCVFVGDEINVGDVLFGYGYPEKFNGDALTLTFEGPSVEHDTGLELLKLKWGQVKSGFSGAPLLNIRTGRVCGIVTISRDVTTDLGGRAVPIRVLLS